MARKKKASVSKKKTSRRKSGSSVSKKKKTSRRKSSRPALVAPASAKENKKSGGDAKALPNKPRQYAFEIASREQLIEELVQAGTCLLYTSPSPRDQRGSRMPSSA